MEEDAHGSELRQHPRALDQRLDLGGAAVAVDEAGLEVPLRGDDRLRRLAQVRDVVERVVEPEDVDAVRGRRGDEAAREVGVHRARADEEAAAQRETERRLDARLEGADPFPRALDAALDRRVEAAAARDLEVREACRVEDLGEPELLGDRHASGERLLPEQANGRVGERRHARDLTAGCPSSLRCGLARAVPAIAACAVAGVREERPRPAAIRVMGAAEGDSRVGSHEQRRAALGREPEAEPVATVRARSRFASEHLGERLLADDRAREERPPERRHVRSGRIDRRRRRCRGRGDGRRSCARLRRPARSRAPRDPAARPNEGTRCRLIPAGAHTRSWTRSWKGASAARSAIRARTT